MRYLPLTDADRRAMLARIGVADIDALFADIPRDKRLTSLVDLPEAQGEMEVERALGALAARNTATPGVDRNCRRSAPCRPGSSAKGT